MMMTANLLDFLAAYGIAPWMAVTGGALLLVVVVLTLAHIVVRGRMHAVIGALDDSARGRVLATGKVSAVRQSVAFNPAPAPFVKLTVDFSMAGGMPPGALGSLLFRRQELAFFATLPGRPQAELVWDAGHAPDLALGRAAGNLLWVDHNMLYGAGEYALRGMNTAALEHAFNDMQSRFGPLLRVVRVSADGPPHMTVLLSASRLNCEEIPALVTALCALGRAALVR